MGGMLCVMKRAPRHAHAVDSARKKNALVRLKRIEGQIRGIQGMVEEERYCADTLIQISAVQESLRAVAQVLLRNHLEHCASEAIRSNDAGRREEMYDELSHLYFKHVR